MRTDYESSKQPIPLPEGVIAWGYRYKARIQTPTRTITIGEFETPDEAHAAYLDAQSTQWNG